MEEIARAETMRDLQRVLPKIPTKSFDFHSRRNDFSRWRQAQSLYAIAARIKDLKIPANGDAKVVQQQMTEIIRNYRKERTKGVIAQFSRNNYDETLFFSRIGGGSLGGKGRGLAFIDMVLRAAKLPEKYPDVYLSIPRTVVVTTDQFTQFLEENDLNDIASGDLPDETLLKIFLSKPLSNELVLNLAEIVQVIHQPICVRSSSLWKTHTTSHLQEYMKRACFPTKDPTRQGSRNSVMRFAQSGLPPSSVVQRSTSRQPSICWRMRRWPSLSNRS